MKIFLAGENGKKRIIKEIVDDSILSRSNNGRKSLKRGQDTSPDRGVRVAQMKMYLASPHTIQKFRDGRQMAITLFGGGMFDEVKNENIHSRHSSMWGG